MFDALATEVELIEIYRGYYIYRYVDASLHWNYAVFTREWGVPNSQMLYIVQEVGGYTEQEALQMCRTFIDDFITGEPHTVTLEIKNVANNPDDEFTWGGNQVTFMGYLYDIGGNPIEAKYLQVSYPTKGEGKGSYGTTSTDTNGYYELSLTPRRGRNLTAFAYAHILGWADVNKKKYLPLYGLTRINNLQITPEYPKKGQPVTITGVLEWEELQNIWTPIQAKTIQLEAVGPTSTKTGSDTTNTNGAFNIIFTPDERGLWTITVTFLGSDTLVMVQFKTT